MKPPIDPSPCTGGGGKIADERLLDAGELPVQIRDDGVGREPGDCRSSADFSVDERGADVRGVDEAVDRQARERDRALDAGMLQRQVGHAPDHGVGAVQRRRVRQLRERHQVVLVLRRDESLRAPSRNPTAVSAEQAAVEQHHRGADAQQARDAEHVAARRRG